MASGSGWTAELPTSRAAELAGLQLAEEACGRGWARFWRSGGGGPQKPLSPLLGDTHRLLGPLTSPSLLGQDSAGADGQCHTLFPRDLRPGWEHFSRSGEADVGPSSASEPQPGELGGRLCLVGPEGQPGGQDVWGDPCAQAGEYLRPPLSLSSGWGLIVIPTPHLPPGEEDGPQVRE